MIKGIRSILFLLFSLLLSFPIAAQIVYQCDFEDEAERSQWTLNPGNRADRCENWWYIGKSGNYSSLGQYGLYVAAKTQNDTLCYTSQATMMTVAYRTITLPKGEFLLTFDWIGKCKSLGDEGVFIYWAPEDLEAISMPTLDLFPWQRETTYCLTTEGNKVKPLYNQGTWDRGAIPLVVKEETETRRLMFVFYSLKGDPTNPSFAIDNIEIGYDTDCPFPTEIQHNLNADATVSVFWRATGSVKAYEIRLCDMQSGQWHNRIVDNVSPGKNGKLETVFSGLEEGAQLVQIRSLCAEENDTVHTNWVSYYFLYYRPGERCVDYMRLDKTTCSWQANYNLDENENPILPYNLTNRGAVDYGNQDYTNTLHTLHYMPNEYDPYSMNKLRTKPNGALASVRIGRYAPTHMSRVRYSYTIPENEEKILVLRYALVLPNPHPDHPSYNPIFAMETLVDGQPLEGGCGDANFTSGYGDAVEWDNAKNYGGDDVYFKDWTTVSLNMKEYAGKTFTVSFTTTGCSLSAHGGYGYITLSCESGEMSGLNCGEENPTTHFTAPIGFSYRWWKDDRDHVLSTHRTFVIDPMDTATYHVDLITLGNEQCYHTLDVSGIPRLPHIEAGVRKKEIEHCQNVVTFYNNSYILYKAYHMEWDINIQDSVMVIDKEFTKGELLHNIVWDFGDGSPRISDRDSLVSHVYPKEGGTYTAWMIGTLNGASGDCVDSIPIDVTVPQVGYADVVLDEGRGYQFIYNDGTIGNTYWSIGDDTIHEYIGECERITYLHIHETKFSIDTSFCEGGAFRLGDQLISETGVYSATLKRQQWPNVDSIVTLTLHVDPALKVEKLPDTIKVCADDSYWKISVKAIQGDMDSVVVWMPEKAINQGFEPKYFFEGNNEIHIDVPMPDSVRPDYYPVQLELGSTRCPGPDTRIILQVDYSSSIIMQREDFLSLLNEDYNGGYTFTSFQWYRNGELIEGATNSFIIVDSTDIGADYYVIPVRSDGVEVRTCPVQYNGMTPLETVPEDNPSLVNPTLVSPGQTISILSDSEWMLIDMWGRTIVPYSHGESVQAPSLPGVYMFVFPGAHRLARIIVK